MTNSIREIQLDLTKPARWFRLYAEFANDPKVQMLSEVNQRRFIMLLCLRCSNGDVTLHDDEIAFQLRISNDEWQETKKTLVTRKLVTESNMPAAWGKRQCLSDSSVERVRRHRENKKQKCNVTETLPKQKTNALEIEIEIEKDIKEKEKINKKEVGANAPLQPQAAAVESIPADKPDRKLKGGSQADMHAELTRRGCTTEVANDFLKIRNARRSPLTATAIAGIEREADKAQLPFSQAIAKAVERGWQSFEADWLLNQSRASPRSADALHDKNAASIAAAKAKIFGSNRGEVIEHDRV